MGQANDEDQSRMAALRALAIASDLPVDWWFYVALDLDTQALIRLSERADEVRPR